MHTYVPVQVPMEKGMFQMKDPKLKSELKWFRDIAGESYGPLGRYLQLELHSEWKSVVHAPHSH